MSKRLIFAVSLSILSWATLASPHVIAKVETSQKLAYTIGKPIESGNLTVFLIRGDDRLKNQKTITLQEALAQKKVLVRETGDVNQLQIENRSDAVVFIQSGDIVKGGRQDRTMQFDMILPPHSGNLPLPAFCVEHGRWGGRGSESAKGFADSNNSLVGKELKLAARKNGDQQEVWDQVASGASQMYHQAAACMPAPAQAEYEQRVQQENQGGSLELALENKHVNATADAQVKKLLHVVDGDKSVVGFAFAVNGKLNTADVYGSNDLFLKMWPKQLKSAALEAVENQGGKSKASAIAKSEVEKFLAPSPKPSASKEQTVNTRTKLVDEDLDASSVFETIDKNSGALVHKSIYAK
jgi:hypothetical protein